MLSVLERFEWSAERHRAVRVCEVSAVRVVVAEVDNPHLHTVTSSQVRFGQCRSKRINRKIMCSRFFGSTGLSVYAVHRGLVCHKKVEASL